jgi:hypothetical protein
MFEIIAQHFGQNQQVERFEEGLLKVTSLIVCFVFIAFLGI